MDNQDLDSECSKVTTYSSSLLSRESKVFESRLVKLATGLPEEEITLIFTLNELKEGLERTQWK